MKTGYLLLAFLVVLSVGTLGYELIEGWSFLDSLFMTVITVTTVGYDEVHPLSTAGRIFTIFLIFIGLGTVLLALSSLGAAMIQMQGQLSEALWRKRMTKQIEDLQNHVIVAGFGRTGQIIVRDLLRLKIPLLVIERDPIALADLRARGIPHISGSAYDEELLKKSGLDRARGFVSVVSSDVDNAFAIMTVKGLNPKIRVVTRAVDDTNVDRLKRAGSDKVIAPFLLGGTRIAQAIANPAVVDFMEVMEDTGVRDIEMADLEVRPGSRVVGQTLGSGALSGLSILVVAMRMPGGQMIYRPDRNSIIGANDKLIVVGHSEEVSKLASSLI